MTPFPPLAGPDPTPAPAPELSAAEGLTLAEATDLLDWLEQRGVRAERLEVGPDGRITVWWRD